MSGHGGEQEGCSRCVACRSEDVQGAVDDGEGSGEKGDDASFHALRAGEEQEMRAIRTNSDTVDGRHAEHSVGSPEGH